MRCPPRDRFPFKPQWPQLSRSSHEYHSCFHFPMCGGPRSALAYGRQPGRPGRCSPRALTGRAGPSPPGRAVHDLGKIAVPYRQLEKAGDDTGAASRRGGTAALAERSACISATPTESRLGSASSPTWAQTSAPTTSVSTAVLDPESARPSREDSRAVVAQVRWNALLFDGCARLRRQSRCSVARRAAGAELIDRVPEPGRPEMGDLRAPPGAVGAVLGRSDSALCASAGLGIPA